jgi:membrane fusion protein, copper/silver efflux system
MTPDERKVLENERGGSAWKSSKRSRPLRLFLALVLLGGAMAGGGFMLRKEPMMAKFTELVGLGHDTQQEIHSANQLSAIESATKPDGDKSKAERKILYYTCSMHPEVKSDKPGKCPICGMNLTPVYGEEQSASKEGPQPVGTFKISPERQQLIGVKFGEVRERPLSKVIRAAGQVSYDETRIAHIHTRISGWIDKLYVDYTGMLVKKGQPLLTIYSPELVSTQQELLIARKAKDSLGTSSFTAGFGSNASSLYESTRERLRLWEIPESEIREIERRGTPNKNLTLYSPINGFVLIRNGFSGHRVTPEMELYSIVDLSTLWVLADVYEYELPMIKLGQTATMTLSSFPGRTFTGKVTYIYPGLEAATRTLKIRLEFSNPGHELKPDMYANVEIRVDYGLQLAVPRDAVLDAGTVQIVFVAREGGTFEPRKVSLGQQVGDQVIVLSGVKEGERVVTSANFLVDSESQLKAAIGSLTGGEHTGH